MKATLKPSEFFSRLKLDALDSATANYIREEILTTPNIDVAEASEVLDQIIETIRENFPEALSDMPKDIQEEQVEEEAPIVVKAEEEKEEAPKILKHVRLTNHINAFKSILPLKTGEDKKKIQGYIKGFQTLLSITSKEEYADGGTIHDNNYTVLYVKEGKVAEKHFHAKGDASEFAKKHKSKAFKFSSGGKVYATYGKHGYKIYKDGTELENVTSDGVDIETIRGNAQERVIHLANQHGATMGGALNEYEDGGGVDGFKVGDKVEIIAGYEGYVGKEGEIIDFNEHQEPNIKTDSHPDGITCRIEDIKHIDEAVVDLFETPENLPSEVQAILDKYSDTNDYRELEKCLEELEPLGYTFDYYLDGVPCDLRKTSDKMRKGGLIKNQYEGKSPEYVWNKWTGKQRAHFFNDHEKVIGYDGNIHAFTAEDYKDLPNIVKTAITEHVNEGQYGLGGWIKNKFKKKKKKAHIIEYAVIYTKPDGKRETLIQPSKKSAEESESDYKKLGYTVDIMPMYNAGGLSVDEYLDILKDQNITNDQLRQAYEHKYELHDQSSYGYGGRIKKPTKEQKEKVAKVMKEFKEGDLTSHGKTVEDPKQAIAIALSEADLSNIKKNS